MSVENFNFSLIKPNSFILIFGPVNSLKNQIIKQIIYYQNNPANIIINRDQYLNYFYEKFINKLFIYDLYEKELFNKLANRHEIMKTNNLTNSNSLIAFEESVPLSLVFKSEEFDKMIKTHKSINLTLIITYRVCSKYFDNFVENVDLVFLCGDLMFPNIKRYWVSYGKYFFETFEDFYTEFNRITKTYNSKPGIYNKFMVLDMKNKKYWKIKVKNNTKFNFKTIGYKFAI